MAKLTPVEHSIKAAEKVVERLEARIEQLNIELEIARQWLASLVAGK